MRRPGERPCVHRDTTGGYHKIVDTEIVDGRLYLHRSAEERDPLLVRLRRIEGQVRGLQTMLEQDRYCADELQQAHAMIAAMREVASLIALQHLTAGVERAAGEAGTDRALLLDDMRSVLRAAIRQI